MSFRHPETEAQLKREREIADIWEKSLGVTMRKKEINGYTLDYDMLAGKALIAVVEVKTTKYPYRRFPYYFISAAKFRAGIEEAKKLGVEFILTVGFQDGVYYYVYDEAHKIEYAKEWGRVDRQDRYDMEEAAKIPQDLFRDVNGACLIC